MNCLFVWLLALLQHTLILFVCLSTFKHCYRASSLHMYLGLLVGSIGIGLGAKLCLQILHSIIEIIRLLHVGLPHCVLLQAAVLWVVVN